MAVNLIDSTDIEVIQDGSDIKLEFANIDSTTSTSSTNPVENQAITNYVDGKISNISGTSQTTGYSQEYINNAVLDTYSTTEMVIGKWYNNKPIYRKVLTISQQALPNNKWLFIDHNIGVANYITFYGFVDVGSIQPIPRLVTDAVAGWGIGGGDFTTNRIGIQFGTNYNNINSGYIVLEYTKSTD